MWSLFCGLWITCIAINSIGIPFGWYDYTSDPIYNRNLIFAAILLGPLFTIYLFICVILSIIELSNKDK